MCIATIYFVTYPVINANIYVLFCVVCSQRATSDEMVMIKKHYETSKEDEVKLLDKPEQ